MIKKLVVASLLASCVAMTTPVLAETTMGAPYVMSDAELETMAKNQQAFQIALRNGNASEVERLISQGITPNIILDNGDTPLTFAFRSDSWSVVKVLLKTQGINVNMENRHGETPLMMAVFKGRTDEFEALLKAGAKVNKAKGWTPLHYAATEARIDLMKRLIELGANVNAQTKAGVTPLDMAARRPSREAVMVLLRAGAYRDYCTDGGLSPADFARKAGDEELAKFLAIETCAVRGPADPSVYGTAPKISLFK